ncbi:M64 family metallopeptidase [Sediminicoccus rosea]|uniref:Uncharacterized protein n=1 Tax=Sediminicoccus rosea TaxID=1225128 RepID=A0ABZ0PDV2_9PROT|nr:hypothetical protein [Sediminicoccus rosea]WPB83884.1 hypothetical protein R9Z33_17420 [Sediminicoccus rosea]
MASKIHPFGVGNALDASFKLILVAEGFTAAQRGAFSALCHDLIEAILATTPFNRTRVRPEWLTVIKVFMPSTSSGPRIAGAPGHSTLLSSFVDGATNRLAVDHGLLGAVLATQSVTTAVGEVPLAALYGAGGITYGVTGGLVAVIAPAMADPAGADDHVRPAAGEYHLVATTANGLWHQVVLRGIGTALGLADEYEREGAAFAAATETSPELANAPNVVFSDAPPVMNADFIAWRHVMSPVEALAPAVVQPRPAHDLPNTALPAAPYAAGRVAFWEGGAGYRRKAYRPAEDCLMRRAPGLGYLPARVGAIGFCPVCVSHLRSAIG